MKFERMNRSRLQELKNNHKNEHSSQDRLGFANAVQESLHFQYSSNEFLLAAYAAVPLLRTCYATSTNDEASNICFNIRDGWKHLNVLSLPTLSECLGSIGHAGLKTLRNAEKKHEYDTIEL
jgi:hypothetical protein